MKPRLVLILVACIALDIIVGGTVAVFGAGFATGVLIMSIFT